MDVLLVEDAGHDKLSISPSRLCDEPILVFSCLADNQRVTSTILKIWGNFSQLLFMWHRSSALYRIKQMHDYRITITILFCIAPRVAPRTEGEILNVAFGIIRGIRSLHEQNVRKLLMSQQHALVKARQVMVQARVPLDIMRFRIHI